MVNPKSEIRYPNVGIFKTMRCAKNRKVDVSTGLSWFKFWIWEIKICLGFRISSLGFKTIKYTLLLLIPLSLSLTSCAVKQWQREHLSDPIMRIDDDPEAMEMKQHLLERREGSSGGHGAAGGGCGC